MANDHIEIVYQRCTLTLLSVAYKEKEENHISSNEDRKVLYFLH
jgi:hypothetical protein